jgi:ATP-dependent DNA helicase RecG
VRVQQHGGGHLVLGVEDETRAVFGLDGPLAVEERVASIVTDSVHPQITPEIEISTWRGRSVVVVTVHPGPSRPYHVRSLRRESGTYVRVGSTNRRASPEIIAELGRTARNVTFDEEPVARYGAKEIDLDLARERFSEVRELRRRDLQTLRLVTTVGGRIAPTRGGILLFGHHRHEQFPDARLRMARFAGADRSRIIDRQESKTDLVAAIDEAVAFVERHTRQGMEIEGSRRRDLPEYPPVAIREAVVNSVAHADYSQSGSPIRLAIFDDRLEIENPGLLPFGLTIEEVIDGVSKLRNRVIGRVFHELGLIEQWGSGIQRIISSCRSMGLAAPAFEEIGTHFRVTLRATREAAAPRLTRTPGRIVETLRESGPLSTTAIAKALGLTPRTVRTHLGRLADAGLVVELGQGPHDPHKTWTIPAGGD